MFKHGLFPGLDSCLRFYFAIAVLLSSQEVLEMLKTFDWSHMNGESQLKHPSNSVCLSEARQALSQPLYNQVATALVAIFIA